ncbi:MAG: PAS domain-containing sensor histidine kinase [Gammaproteobacteria bacterium]|nr:MAG: PAS domain-containing sensor histidine kinase [Gammaproteobacteria bacterium]
MLSPQGVIISWNAGAQRFKGYTANEIIGTHFSAFYTEADKAVDLPNHALKIAEAEGQFEAEGWRVRKDGTRFWANVVIDPIRDHGGQLIGFAKVTRDITERKRAANVLRESEEQFRLLVQGVTDYAIYMLSPEGIITNWNAGAKRIKGYFDNEVIGTHFSRFYTDEDRQSNRPSQTLNKAAIEGRFESEGWRVRKDGTSFWAHVVVDAIQNDMGELIGFAKVTRDITERREAAAALEKAQLALFQSQKMESMGQITGGVAHDFNNLLNVITNGLAILQSRISDSKDLKIIDTMERAAQRGATLIQQLLTFARQQPSNPSPQNLNSVIRSFESILRRANDRRLEFEITLAAKLPDVNIDPGLFESALLNLVVNARDATPEGGNITVQTSVVNLKENEINSLLAGDYVKVEVRDSGHGIPTELIEKIIEPFFTTKPLGKGTGLGLSQVYGFAKQSCGDLHISSSQGHGTVISLFFPALSNTGDTASSGRKLEQVLIVDDQPDVLDMAIDLIKMLGYEVYGAGSGEEAIRILCDHSDIDILFTDVMMPGMNGVELARHVKRMLPSIKILLASGFTGQAKNIDDIGDFRLIPKPYQLADIAKELRII